MPNRGFIVSTLKDGDSIVHYPFTVHLIGTLSYCEITIPILVSIDKVIEIHATATNPAGTVTESPQMIQVISGNVVGFTIGTSISTTLQGNICCIGF